MEAFKHIHLLLDINLEKRNKHILPALAKSKWSESAKLKLITFNKPRSLETVNQVLMPACSKALPVMGY